MPWQEAEGPLADDASKTKLELNGNDATIACISGHITNCIYETCIKTNYEVDAMAAKSDHNAIT